jgi:MoxR-like ATPase
MALVNVIDEVVQGSIDTPNLILQMMNEEQ